MIAAPGAIGRLVPPIRGLASVETTVIAMMTMILSKREERREKRRGVGGCVRVRPAITYWFWRGMVEETARLLPSDSK